MFESHRLLCEQLSIFTGAPYVVLTDCCTHALEVCLRGENPNQVLIPNRTYLSVIMTLEKLDINYQFKNQDWIGEYNLAGTSIWDSARLLAPNMYRPNAMQCLSFGHTKPVDNKRGGAILLDDFEKYHILQKMCYDGRDLDIQPWENQKVFNVGFHYNMPVEHAENILKLLEQYINNNNFEPKQYAYPDCSKLKIEKPFDKSK